MDGYSELSPELVMSGESLADTRAVVLRVITQVAADQGKRLPTLADGVPLLDSGLDSLCLAVIVSCLEDELGVDPFATQAEIDFPSTVGDFIRLYEHARV